MGRMNCATRRLVSPVVGPVPGLRQVGLGPIYRNCRKYTTNTQRVYDSRQQTSEGQDDDTRINVEYQRRAIEEHHGGLTTNATDDMLLSRMDGSTLTNEAIFSDAIHARVRLPRKKQGMAPRKVMTATKTEVTSQHFGGALTTLVFGAALLSERLNGVGIVQNLELHNKGFHPVLLSAILMLLVASAWPEKREWKKPTLLVRVQMAGARFAYLGLAGAIAAEMVTGRGVLSLLDVETGVEAFSDVEAVLIFLTMLVLTGPQSREIP